MRGKVYIIAGVAGNLLLLGDGSEMYVRNNAILAMCLGVVKTVLDKLANKSSTVRGTLHGRTVDGRRFERQPHLGDVSRLKVYTGCESITGPPNFTEEKALIEEEEEDGKPGGEWSPAEFKVLGMVEWKITDTSTVEDDDEDV